MKARAVAAGLLGAALVAGGWAGLEKFPVTPIAAAVAAAPVAQAQTLPDFSAIVEANKAAVVNITASKACSPRRQSRKFPECRRSRECRSCRNNRGRRRAWARASSSTPTA